MRTTRLSSRGRIVLPKAIRDAHGWAPGTALIIEDSASGVLLRPRVALKPTSLDQVAGSLRFHGRPKTVEETDDALAAEVRSQC